MNGSPVVDSVQAHAFTVATDEPESDGTLSWSSTTAVVVEAESGTNTGIGYSYTDQSAAGIVNRVLAEVACDTSVFDVRAAHDSMHRAIRNFGTHGIAMAALSAVDLSLWDLKARVLGIPLTVLVGTVRDAVPVYGSGGFTSYDDRRLGNQLCGWVADGVRQVKMKVGRDPGRDEHRIDVARRVIGDEVALFVDANGAYSAGQAVDWATRFVSAGVTWFEEPVSSEDLRGLRRVRDRAPAGLEIAAGEYGDSRWTFDAMAGAGAVDVLQIDATRCGGITGFLDAAAIASAHGIPVSAHCAPTAHLAPACASSGLRHIEWFWDHTRVEPMLFDGVPAQHGGVLRPDLSTPGNGLTLKRPDVDCYVV